MKTELTIEQSAKLIKRGISKEKASKVKKRKSADSKGTALTKAELKPWRYVVAVEKQSSSFMSVGLMRFESKDIFTLTDLLELLPKDIGQHDFHIVTETDYYEVSYSLYSYSNEIEEIFIENTLHTVCCTELIDALYELLLWVIDNKYLKV